MKKNIMFQSAFFFTAFLTLFLSLVNPAGAVASDNPRRPEYVPGEVLVKFKEGADPRPVLKNTNLEIKDLQRVHSIKPATAKFKKDYKLEKDTKNGWYSFLGKKYKEISDIPDEEMFQEAYKNMPETERGLYRSYKLKLPDGVSVDEAINKLKNNPDVEYAEPNGIVKVQMLPNDTYYSTSGSWGQPYDDLWGIKKIQCEQAWDMSQGEGVVVAVIDTGVDYNHPDLAANIWTNPDEIPDNGIDDDGNGYIDDVYGYDFAYNDFDPQDGHGHGTHVSGTIAAVGNNNLGIIGVAPRAKIMAVKGLDNSGSGDISTLADCVIYAADNGAKVLNNSWGGTGTSQVLIDAFHYADSKGCVAVAAAGNSNMDVKDFTPANIDTVIAVAATDSADAKASFSNYGIKVDVAAPGVDILSLRAPGTDMYGDSAHFVPPGDINAKYYRANGTSMACPHVAGLAALILSQHAGYTNAQVKWLIKDTVDVLPGIENMFYPGFGRINTSQAAQYPEPPPQLIARISSINIDYINQRAHIRGTAGGQDFNSFLLEYKTDNDIWLPICSSSEPIDGELYDWYIKENLPKNTVLRLTVHSGDSRAAIAYTLLNIDRYIEPAQMSYAMWSSIYNKVFTQAIVPAGGLVPFVGRYFGNYQLEWKKSGTDEWHADGIDYSDLDPGYLGRWDTLSAGEAGRYYVRLNDLFGSECDTEVVLDSSIMNGWPVVMSPLNTSGQMDSSEIYSKIGNLDDDPASEIVTMRSLDASARVYVHDDDGTLKLGWPKIINYEVGYSPMTLADIDGDGKDEIFIATRSGFTNTLRCLNANGDVVFQKRITAQDWRGDTLRDPIIVTDLNGDLVKEIIYRHSDAIYMFDPNGSDLPGWPKAMTTEGWIWSFGAGYNNFMAVGNFDSDPDLELVVVQNRVPGQNSFCDEVIHVFNLDGTYVSGWPQTIEDSRLIDWVACGDMTQDGRDEIALAGDDANYSKKLYLFGGDGSRLFVKDISSGAPRSLFCMMSDLNGDKKDELVFTHEAQKKIYAVNAAGLNITGWPSTVPDNIYLLLARLICDIDADGKPEVLGCYWARKPDEQMSYLRMFVMNSDGTLDTANQFYDKFMPFEFRSLNYCDMDNDGYGDLVVDAMLPSVWADDTRIAVWNWTPSIYVFRANAPYGTTPRYWPTYFADKSNTARHAANLPPVIVPIGNKVVSEGAQLQFTVSCSDPDGGVLTYSASDLPQGATFNRDTQTFAWTPSYTQAGAYPLTFTVSDGELTASAAITITVNNVNRPPVLDPIRNKKSPVSVKLEFVINGTDPDGDQLTYSASGVPFSIGATFAPAAHKFTWTPGNGQAGTYPAHFEVTDGGTLVSSEDIVVYILPDDEPVFDPLFDKNVKVGEVLCFAVTARDPNNDPLTYAASNLPPGAVFNPDTHTFNWTPQAGQQGTYRDILFTASDGSQTATKVIWVFVSHQAAPVLDRVGDVYIGEGEDFSLTLRAKSPIGLPLTYSVSNNPAGSSLSGAIFTWTPNPGQAGAYRDVVFSVTDGTHTDTSVCWIFVSLSGAPVIEKIDELHVVEGHTLIFTINATDPNGDPLTYLPPLNAPTGSSFDAATRTFTWTPAIGEAGVYNDIIFGVTDGVSTAEEDMWIFVHANGAPVVDPLPEQRVKAGQTLTFTVSAADPNGDALTYKALNLPQGAVFENRAFTWTPASGQIGTYKDVLFEVSDGAHIALARTWIFVTENQVAAASNGPPVLATKENKTVEVNKSLKFKLNSFAADKTNRSHVVYYAKRSPRYAFPDTSTGIFRWKPARRGAYKVKFRVKDPAP